MSDAAERLDQDILRALEREVELLAQRGQTVRAAEVHRLLRTFHQRFNDHQAAVGEMNRCEKRTKSRNGSPEDAVALLIAQAVIGSREVALAESRERALWILNGRH